MRRNPLYVFKDNFATGIHDVPLKSMVHIIDSDGAGAPMFLQLVSKDGIGPSSTIADLLADPTLFITAMPDLDTSSFLKVDGSTQMSTTYTPVNVNDVSTKKYVDDSVIPSELAKVQENGHTGWRLNDADPVNYGDIGKRAVDLSIQTSANNSRGATGDYSFATGYNTQASGYYSTAEGYKTRATGYSSHTEGGNTYASGDNAHAEGYLTVASSENSHAEGYRTEASGKASHAEGYNTKANGIASHAEGYEIEASGIASHAEGYRTKAGNYAMHAAGKYNVGTATDTIHETGIGQDDSNRANAFEIYTDGKVVAPELTTTLISDSGTTDKVLVTKEYVSTLSASGLEKIIENSNTGWRLIGRDPDNYGDIGKEAVDLSYSGASSTTNGATGDYSTAFGIENRAQGSGSFTTGIGNYATAPYSTAIGVSLSATGYASFAGGLGTYASGEGSHCIGANTEASGDASHAEGRYTKAQNDSMHAAGKYNVGTATDTIHETGIGASNSNRANAFEIYTDGTLTAPEATNANIDSRGTKAIITKEYADANYDISAKSIDELNDVDTSTTAPSLEDTLKWDGTNWVPVNKVQRIFTDNKFTSSAGQTDFVVTGEVFDTYQCEVFTNGLRDIKDDYTVTDDGNDTTISFTSGKNDGDVVVVSVCGTRIYQVTPSKATLQIQDTGSFTVAADSSETRRLIDIPGNNYSMVLITLICNVPDNSSYDIELIDPDGDLYKRVNLIESETDRQAFTFNFREYLDVKITNTDTNNELDISKFSISYFQI